MAVLGRLERCDGPVLVELARRMRSVYTEITRWTEDQLSEFGIILGQPFQQAFIIVIIIITTITMIIIVITNIILVIVTIIATIISVMIFVIVIVIIIISIIVINIFVFIIIIVFIKVGFLLCVCVAFVFAFLNHYMFVPINARLTQRQMHTGRHYTRTV